MRKVIFYGAISLDGYLADKDYSLDWLFKYNDQKIMEESYQPFFKQVDTIIMGRQTYDDLMQMSEEFPYPNTEVFVLSHREINSEYVKQTDKTIAELVKELKETTGKDIWIVGGGQLVSSLIEQNLIDTLQIQITPDLLGSGVKLFQHMNHTSNFKTIFAKQYGELIDVKYQLKRPTA
ncbi:dihydrofolate reductase family protein [Companilactobacillus jidongensis]|uniref:dihydrofolate reductase family protein n=1 Tax=Companilactobacillus jidongensis TaxID=2486006 RepID=UPI000F78224E|nr:dihydrofolate reductase family protein [Companilactobacillus jidongensis]